MGWRLPARAGEGGDDAQGSVGAAGVAVEVEVQAVPWCRLRFHVASSSGGWHVLFRPGGAVGSHGPKGHRQMRGGRVDGPGEHHAVAVTAGRARARGQARAQATAIPQGPGRRLLMQTRPGRQARQRRRRANGGRSPDCMRRQGWAGVRHERALPTARERRTAAAAHGPAPSRY